MCFAGSDRINSAHDKTRGNTLAKTDLHNILIMTEMANFN